jgi:hypothetical protein
MCGARAAGTDCGGTNYNLELESFQECDPCTCNDGEINGLEQDYTNGTSLSGCFNAIDLVYKDDVCEYYIDRFGFTCEEDFCPTCPFGDRCDLTCNFCPQYECGGPDCDACPTCSNGVWDGDETGVLLLLSSFAHRSAVPEKYSRGPHRQQRRHKV